MHDYTYTECAQGEKNILKYFQVKIGNIPGKLLSQNSFWSFVAHM